MDKKKTTFTPQKLRSLLGFILFLLIAGGGALFYFGLMNLKQISQETTQQAAQADAEEARTKELQTLKKALADSSNVISKVDSLYSTPDSYKTQLESDIKNYASAAGIAAPSVAADDSNTPGSNILSVTFKDPISYDKFLSFLHGLETNIPKMNIASLSIHRFESDKNLVSVTTLQVKALVR